MEKPTVRKALTVATNSNAHCGGFMRVRTSLIAIFISFCLVLASSVFAQDLGPHIKKVKEGIYVESPGPVGTNCAIILTQDGVVLIDSGSTPVDSREVLAAVKKL